MGQRIHRPWLFIAFSIVTLATAPALAWNAHGHRTIARLAVDGLPTDMPTWLHDADIVARIAEQACEPDRWRGTKRLVIGHELNPEHYLDVEDLDAFGLTLDNIPRLRNEYLRAMILAKDKNPDKFPPYDRTKDPERAKEWPGFVLHAIDEHFALLQSSFNTMRILEAVDATDPSGKPARAAALRQERENIIHEMGILAHYVGDTAQPLHTTKHHHGWVGENPNGYSRDNGIHSYIDGKVVDLHKLDFDSLRPGMTYGRHINPADPWDDVVAYLRRSFDKVEPLYKLQKEGTLAKAEGKEFITGCFRDAGDTLAALYSAAWTASKPTDSEISSFLRFNELRGKGKAAEAETKPETKPESK